MAQTDDDVKILTQHFMAEITGLMPEVNNLVSMDVGKYNQNVCEASEGGKPEYRTYTYSTHEFEDLTMTLQQGPENKKIAEWVRKATESGGGGDALRRDVSLFVYGRDKSSILRTYHAKECFPVSLQLGDHGLGSDAKTETLTCKVGYIEVE